MEEQENITTAPTFRSGPASTSVPEPPLEIRVLSFPIHSYMLRTTDPRSSEGPPGFHSRVGSMHHLPIGLESNGDAILDVQYPQLPAVEEMAEVVFPLPSLSEVADVSGADSLYPSPPQLSPEVVTSEYTHSITTAITTSSSPSTTSSTSSITIIPLPTSFSPATVSCPPGQLAMAWDHSSHWFPHRNPDV